MVDLRGSPSNVADSAFAIAIYPSLTNTIPQLRLEGLTWPELGARLAPAAGPLLVNQKTRVPYVTPGELRKAPKTGKTREEAQRRCEPLDGYMRSASHVVGANWMLFDFDGITATAFDQCGRALKGAGIAFLAWTSFSHGAPGKPGVHLRLALPLDQTLEPSDYKRVHAAINAGVFGGAADPTSGRLCQAQGVWATHPDRAHLARRWSVGGGLVDVGAILASLPAARVERPADLLRAVQGTGTPLPLLTILHVRDALGVLDPNGYETWNAVMSYLPAIAAGGPDAERLCALGVAFSERASEQNKARNDLPSYNPERRFASLRPMLSREIALASLFAMARDAATKNCRDAFASGDWTGRGSQWRYLAKWHPKTWESVSAPSAEKEAA